MAEKFLSAQDARKLLKTTDRRFGKHYYGVVLQKKDGKIETHKGWIFHFSDGFQKHRGVCNPITGEVLSFEKRTVKTRRCFFTTTKVDGKRYCVFFNKVFCF
ncbi:MAG: hypothetical protein R3Y43_06255 [Alphaproteobacteria bacterium]